MKIGYIIGGFPNLSETFIINQITGLIDLGHNVFIFPKYKVAGVSQQVIEKYKLDLVAFYPSPVETNLFFRYLKSLRLIPKYLFTNLSQVVKSLNPVIFGKQALTLRMFYQILPFLGRKMDIIQVHYADYLDRAVLMKKTGVKSPVILMMHGADIRTLNESEGTAYREQFEFVDIFLTISEFSYKVLLRNGIPENKIIMHHVGVDTNRLKTIERSEISKNEIVLLSVGRLADIKGHIYGLEAVSILRDSLPGYKIKYVIVGDGPELDNLKYRTVELGLSNEVILKGAKNQDELFIEYASADIFVHPSLAEITPLVIMEAFASGLPVVATDVGAVSEIVHHNENGFLLEKENPAMLADSLKTLIENPTLRTVFGKKGRRYITENFDISILNKKLEQIYLSCLRN